MVLYWLRTIFPRWSDFEIRGRDNRLGASLMKVIKIAMAGGIARWATEYWSKGLGYQKLDMSSLKGLLSQGLAM